jgi:hypothetical protein
MGLLDKAAAKIIAFGDRPAARPAGLPAGDRAAAGGESPAGAASFRKLSRELQNEIVKYCNTFTSVHGIVLRYPRNYDEEKEGEPFCRQVDRIVAALGAAFPLSSRHVLVLFSNTVDRELLAHRLSKSLDTEAPAVFQADSVNIVVEYIRPFL